MVLEAATRLEILIPTYDVWAKCYIMDGGVMALEHLLLGSSKAIFLRLSFVIVLVLAFPFGRSRTRCLGQFNTLAVSRDLAL